MNGSSDTPDGRTNDFSADAIPRVSPTPTPLDLPGSKPVRIGNYQLLARLGEGGMGEVFKAVHVGLGREVALKRIRPEKLRTSAAVKRFLKEVRAAAKVDHPFIVRAYDAGTEGASHYLVMELVDGVDLRTIVNRNGPLPVEEVLRVAVEVGLALRHLHQHHLVHRDLKPTNLIRVRATGSVKMLDLGLARLEPIGTEDDLAKSMTLRGTFLGTPDYMAPEQVLNARGADIRSDLYSLGCTLYFLLTGTVPFPGGTSVQKMLRQTDEQPRPLSQLRTGLPAGVIRIVEHLMEKDPTRRYQTPKEVLADLASLALHPSVGPAADPVSSDPSGGPGGESEDFWQGQFSGWMRQESTLIEAGLLTPKPEAPVRRTSVVRPVWWAGATVALLAVGLGLFWWLGRLGSGSTSDQPVSKAPAPPDESARRRELHKTFLNHRGSRESINAARELRLLTSPWEALASPAIGQPALRIGEPRARQFGAVRSVAASADGRWIVTGGRDPGVQLWNANPLTLRTILRGHETPLWNVAVSPDGKWVAGVSGFDGLNEFDTGMERSLRLWNTGTRAESLKIDAENGGWCLSACFSQDGKWLLVGQYEKASLWSLETLEMVREFKDPGMEWSGAVAFSPDGATAHTGGNGKTPIRIWETATGKRIAAITSNNAVVGQLLPAGDGRRFLEISEGTAKIRRSPDGELLREFKFPSRTIVCGAWSESDSRVVLGAGNGSIGWFDAGDGRELKSVVIPNVSVACLIPCPKPDRIVVGCSDGAIRQFRPDGESEIDPPPMQLAARDFLFFDQDRRVAVITDAGAPRRYDLPGGEILKGRSQDGWRTIGFSADGSRALASIDGAEAVLWNPQDNQVTEVRLPGVSRARLAVVTPDRRGVAHVLQDERTIRFREFGDDAAEQRHDEPAEIRCLTVSLDGRRLVYGTDRGEVVCLRLPDLVPVSRAKPGAGNIRRVALAPDGETAYVIGNQLDITRVDLKNGEWVGLRGRSGEFHAITVSADGRYLAAAQPNGDVLITPTESDTGSRRLRVAGMARSLAFSTDGSVLAVGLANGVVDFHRLGGLR